MNVGQGGVLGSGVSKCGSGGCPALGQGLLNVGKRRVLVSGATTCFCN